LSDNEDAIHSTGDTLLPELSPANHCLESSANASVQTRNKKRDPCPPPFLLRGVTDFKQLIALLSPVTTGFRLKTIRRSLSRITVDDGSIYRVVQKLCKDN